MSEPALLPERAGCPQCGGNGKRWRTLRGRDVCDECWLDTAMDEQQEHWRQAVSSIPKQPTPFKRRRPRAQFPVRMAQARTDNGDRDKWKTALAKLVQPGYNSICLLCSHIYYGAAMSSCSRCGGLCVQRTDHDLGLMGRHATQLVETEK